MDAFERAETASVETPSSAVQDMTVAEVRKALQKIRQLWFQSSFNAPLFICQTLFPKHKTIAEFCIEFVYGHHLKRHYKSTQQKERKTQKESSVQTSSVSTGVAGPKGLDASDPFPFTPGWKPKYHSGIENRWWEKHAAIGKTQGAAVLSTSRVFPSDPCDASDSAAVSVHANPCASFVQPVIPSTTLSLHTTPVSTLIGSSCTIWDPKHVLQTTVAQKSKLPKKRKRNNG
jgi:hypothetical protein